MLAAAMGKSLVCVLDCPFISLIAERSTLGNCTVCVNPRVSRVRVRVVWEPRSDTVSTPRVEVSDFTVKLFLEK